MPLATLSDIKRADARRYLADYTEATWNKELHRWQRENLCPILDELGKGKGLRLLIHGPLQYGKSIILTKRMPAQKLGQNPDLRIGIAAYNEDHATRLTKSVRATLLDPRHQAIFPDPAGRISATSAMNDYSTARRIESNDAQASVRAYGLNGGFTGNGVDLLLIDDPYKSPEEAKSKTINEKTWEWWDEVADGRVEDGGDVVVMFHRYHIDDLAGRLKLLPNWRYVRFPAIADKNPEGDDPTRYWRMEGELLSPRKTREFLEEKKKQNPSMFASMYQGVPQDEAGALFTRESFEVIERRPHLDLWMRSIDPASAVQQSNDDTASGLVGIDSDGSIVIADVTAWKRPWPQTRDGVWEGGKPYEKDVYGNPLSWCREDGLVQIIKKDQDFIEAEAEAHVFERQATYLVGFAKKGMGLPMVQDLGENELTASVPLYPVEEGRADKLQKANVWAAKAYIRPIRLVRGSWNEAFIAACLAFRGDGTTPDDKIDAVSVAMILLRMYRGKELEQQRLPQPGTVEYHEALVRLNRD